MKNELAFFDVYPKVVPCHQTSRIHVRPLSRHVRYEDGKTYYVRVIPMNERARDVYCPDYPVLEVQPENGALCFEFAFGAEQQYELWVSEQLVESNSGRAWRDIRRDILHVYAVEPDLHALRPLRGNLHIHSFRSDGVEAPEIVAACYRRAGYDFIAMTDHELYAPSIEAIQAYAGASIDMTLLPGEEVHATGNKVHIINFGGAASVNDLYRDEPERYEREVRALEDELRPELPAGVCSYEVASSYWVFENIRRVGGVSILCHPNWIYWGAYNQPPEMYRYFMAKGGFDCLELINGGNQPHENQFQVTEWIAAPRRPVPVGTDDSHGAVNGEWFDIGKTYLLAASNAQKDILDALKAGRCCAVEQYHGQVARLYGEARLAAFCAFLDAEYFPLHDELCVEEGRLMAAYVNGAPDAAARLALCAGQTERLHRHLFGME